MPSINGQTNERVRNFEAVTDSPVIDGGSVIAKDNGGHLGDPN